MSGLDHEKRIRIRDRVAKIGLPILVSICILSLIVSTVGIVVIYKVYTDGHAETQQSNKATQSLINKSIQSSNSHHNQTSSQNQVIEKQNEEIKTLLGQIQAQNTVLQQAETKLGIAGTYIAQSLAWLTTFQGPLCQIPGTAATGFCTTPPPTPPSGIFGTPSP